MRELISWFEDEYIYNFMIDLQGFITLKYSRGSLLEDSMIAWLYKLFAGDNEMILKLEACLIVGHDTINHTFICHNKIHLQLEGYKYLKNGRVS